MEFLNYLETLDKICVVSKVLGVMIRRGLAAGRRLEKDEAFGNFFKGIRTVNIKIIAEKTFRVAI